MRAGCARVKMATIADLRDPMGQRQSTMVLAHRSSAVLFVLKQTDADGAVMSQSASVEVSHPMMNLPLETVRHSMGIVFGLCWKAQVILARALLRHAAHADSTTMLKSALSVEQGHTWSRFEPLLLLASPLNTSRAKKCVSECSSDRVAVGSTNAQRVCSEPFTCSAGHVDDGVRELGWGYRSPPHARADAECSCSSNCSACTVDKAGSHCSLCADGFEIFQGTCVAECPSDTDKIVLRKSGSPGTLCWPREYCHHGNQIEGGVCQCPAGCVECRGSLCRRCEDGYTFLDGFCVAEERCPASLPAATIMTRHGEASFSECKPKLTKEEKAAAKAAAKADAKA